MKRFVLPLLSAAALLAPPARATVPMPAGATYAKGLPLTVAGYFGSALQNFPVLVRLAENAPAGFSYNDVTNAAAVEKGDIDLCFVDAVGAGLPFEIDTWDPNGDSFVWVRLPSMSQGAKFYMCWGSDTPGTNVCNASPWSDYTGVWHMNEDAAGITTIHDSTTNHLDGTTVATSSSKTDGKVGRARFITSNTANAAGSPYDSGVTIDMTSDAAKLAVVDNVVPEFTASFWVRPQNNAQWWYFITRKAADKGPGWGLQNGSENNNASFKVFRAYGGAEDDGNCLNLTGITALEKQKWVKLDAVWKSDKTFILYVNGAEAGSGTLKNQAGNGNQTKLALGGAMAPMANDQKSGRGVYGDMDEIRLRKGALSPDWLAADYATQANASFLTAGTVETPTVASGPIATLSPSSVDYTNATIALSIASLGGAGSVDIGVEISATDDFATILQTESTTATGIGSYDVPFAGLAFGTAYYARAVLDNHDHAPVTTDAISFATPTPGAPAGTAAFDERGFTTLAATGTTTAFGTGGTSAAMRLEASTDGFETVAAFSPEAVAALGEAESFTISGFAPDTAYALRLRITNNWGVATTVALPDASTRAVPFATTGLGWTFSPDGSTVDITFGVSGIYDGATGSATLYFGETANPTASQGARAVTAAPASLSWEAIPVTADPMYAKVVLSATLDGRAYSQTYAAPIAAGSTAVSVSDFANHQATTNAVLLHVGDVATLPELAGGAHYFVGNKLFGKLDGNVLTALRPGILGVNRADADGSTNTLPVVILPEVGGNGEIYLFDETCTGNNTFQWASVRPWKKLCGESENKWPQNPDDVAIFALFNQKGGAGMVIDMKDFDVSVGAIYAGHFRDRASSFGTREIQNGSGSRLSFRRTDEKPAVLQLCPNTLASGRIAEFKFNSNIKNISFLTETRISGGWDGTDSGFPRGRFTFSDATTNVIPADVAVELVEMDTQGVGYNAGTVTLNNLSGAGMFWNHSRGLVKYSGNCSAFTGLIRDSGGHGAGGESQGRSGPAYFRTTTLTNASAEVVGWVASDGQDPQWDYRKGCGALYTGYPHFHEVDKVDKPHTSFFPARGATMHGGYIINRFIGSSSWTNSAANSITRDVKRTDFLKTDCGLNYLYGDGGSASNPGNDFIADAFVHENKATLRITDPSRYSLASTATATNITTVLHGVAEHAVGAGGDCETTAAYSVVPWIVSPVVSGNDNNIMLFACFDGTDRLVRPSYASSPLSNWGAQDNAIVWTSGKNSIALAADKTLNSLVLDNSGTSSSDRRLGAGKTLTITSGGLSFSKSAANIGQEDGGDENGFLVLGDATHPAYVWARGSATGPNQIWAPVTAPGGFVAAYTGHLVLGGNQTNILDEVVVNAGTLQLGTAESSCRLARDIPIRIFANATLRIPNDGSTTKSILRFDGSAGWFGKVDLPDGVAASCKKAFIRDYPESPEWESLERGFYGSSDSDVEALATVTHPAFVRDDLFTGTGTLKVVADDRIPPTIMILR